jgi:hypothetical protein
MSPEKNAIEDGILDDTAEHVDVTGRSVLHIQGSRPVESRVASPEMISSSLG